jgi:AcrR family transcriptional regulator
VSATRGRERDIVDATRALFDQRGMQDAPIEEVARAVGLSRALIYRHFSSKEELFISTVSHYLDELAGALREAVASSEDPREQLARLTEAFADFSLAYPAFLDCSLSLMRRPAAALRDAVSDAVWFKLGQAMAACLSILSRVLAEGRDRGVFAVEDPDFTANHLWTAALGTMHLARLGVGVREGAHGLGEPFAVDPAAVRTAAVAAALAIASAGDGRTRGASGP